MERYPEEGVNFFRLFASQVSPGNRRAPAPEGCALGRLAGGSKGTPGGHAEWDAISQGHLPQEPGREFASPMAAPWLIPISRVPTSRAIAADRRRTGLNRRAQRMHRPTSASKKTISPSTGRAQLPQTREVSLIWCSPHFLQSCPPATGPTARPVLPPVSVLTGGGPEIKLS